MNRTRLAVLLALALALAALAGCRGGKSRRPPIHPIDDMDTQPKYRPQRGSAFFADGRADRPLPEGTVAVEHPANDPGYVLGRTTETSTAPETYLRRAPVALDRALVERGRARFEIFCAPCHDRSGSGRGMVVQRGFPPPVDLASERVRAMPDGQIFDTITRGVRNMPAYGKQVPIADRWAIVAWLRVLGRSQHATVADVPPAERAHILPEVR